jgi:chemotaxis response regulator CheB
MIRVLVADDQALLRGSLRLLVDSTPDLTAVGEAGTGTEAVELAVREQPDVILMDIRMPGIDGIEATRQITNASQTAAVTTSVKGRASGASSAVQDFLPAGRDGRAGLAARHPPQHHRCQHEADDRPREQDAECGQVAPRVADFHRRH